MSAKSHLLQLLILLILLAGAALAKQPAYMQVKVYYDTPEELTQLQSMHLDIVQTKENYLDIVTFQDNLDEIILNGFENEIIHEDLTKFYQSRLDPTRDMGGYKTLSEIEAYVDQIIIDHPDIARRQDIGLSLEGRTMWAVKVSDNPDIDENEPEVLIAAAIHAREIITPEICLTTIDMLTDGYGTDLRMTQLVNDREIWFIPVINVDGYYHNEVIAPDGGGMWRKNRRDNGDGSWGVDLNRNFGYMWGFDDLGSSGMGSSELFRGTGPFSEPATQNVRDFTIAHNFELSVHFHSSGSWFGPPYFYNFTLTPDEDKFERMASVMTTFGGYRYSHGVMNGCHEDWDYGEQILKNKILTYIVEVGTEIDGFWPPLDRIPLHLNNNVPLCLFIASVAGRVDGNFEDGPAQPVLSVEEAVESTEYDVSWTLTEDPDNPITEYELSEYRCNIGVLDEGGHLNGYENDIFVSSDINFHSAPESYYSQTWPNSIHYMQTYHPYEVQTDDILEFWTYYDIQDRYDYAYVEISTDGTNFTPIEGNITTNYNPNGLNRGNGITGVSGDWIQGSFDLADFEGQEIFIRFSFYTDGGITREGIYIDDISPISFLDNETIISLSSFDTQHTFTEHPDGYYYYKMRAQDIDGQWSEYSDMAGTYVRPAFICGDTDGDELINILDIVYLINYKYKSGPAPDPLESADVNNDELVNILDIVYLINFKYKEGPEPICP